MPINLKYKHKNKMRLDFIHHMSQVKNKNKYEI